MLKKIGVFKQLFRIFLGIISPKCLASITNYCAIGNFVNWKNPKDLNEKILWLSLCSDTTSWSTLADKYEVRFYLEQHGLENILPRLYGVWERAEDIDYEFLPSSFILKTNHGSGSNIIVKDKKTINRQEVGSQLNAWLKTRFGWPYEPHYLRISPKIIAEELLDASKQPIISSSLIDYKCFCLNGKVDLIWSCYNRTSSSVYVDSHRVDWSYHPEFSIFSNQYRDGMNKVPKPVNLEEMIRISELLSKNFPQVRIDYYEVDNRLYFGEMTFSSNSGTMTFFTKECLLDMGSKVSLPVSNL